MTIAAPASRSRLGQPRPSGLGRRARRDAAVRTGSALALWASLLLVTWWWDVDGGIADLGRGAEALLDSTGRLTGLVASVLLLAQVLLMARLPLLEAAYGQDRLARLHRVVGFTSFDLMVAHVVLITWGYAAGSIARTPGTLWTITWHDPGMLLAAAGTLCLVLVVVTSIRAARRRLRYESWHLLHLYAYLGVGLALPHQLWTGQQFLASPARRVFWWTAWAVTAGLVVAFRLGVPLVRNLRHGLRVAAVVPEAPGITSVWVSGRRLDRLRAEAGQFFTWRFLAGPGWSRANPYSLSAAPDGRFLRITVAEVGDRSSVVAALHPGTRVLVEGPYGRLSPRARSRRRVALIGAGVGITPIRALAEGLDYAPGDAVLVERCHRQPLFRDEVDHLSRTRGLQVLRLPGPRRAPESWFGPGTGEVSDLEALRHWIPDVADRDVYLCGPDGWTALVRRTLAAAGVPEAHVHVESFSY